MDSSSSVEIEIPSVESSAQTVQKMKDHHGNWKIRRKTIELKLAFLYFAFAVLLTLMIIMMMMIYFGFCMRENKKDENWKLHGMFRRWNSSHFGTGHQFLARAEALLEESEDPEVETFETKEVSWIELLEDMLDGVDKQILGKAKEITSQMSREHEEIKKEVKMDSTDLKRQIIAVLKSRSKEVNSFHEELTKKMAFLMDRVEGRNVSSNASASASPPPPPPPPPRFYWYTHFEGRGFTPDAGWEDEECMNLPSYMDKQSESVSLEGQCLVLCPEKNCLSNQDTKCVELHPYSQGLWNLGTIDYKEKISSFRLCQMEEE